MKLSRKQRAGLKLLSVINSCRTAAHAEMARQMYDNFLRLYDEPAGMVTRALLDLEFEQSYYRSILTHAQR